MRVFARANGTPGEYAFRLPRRCAGIGGFRHLPVGEFVERKAKKNGCRIFYSVFPKQIPGPQPRSFSRAQTPTRENGAARRALRLRVANREGGFRHFLSRRDRDRQEGSRHGLSRTLGLPRHDARKPLGRRKALGKEDRRSLLLALQRIPHSACLRLLHGNDHDGSAAGPRIGSRLPLLDDARPSGRADGISDDAHRNGEHLQRRRPPSSPAG